MKIMYYLGKGISVKFELRFKHLHFLRSSVWCVWQHVFVSAIKEGQDQRGYNKECIMCVLDCSTSLHPSKYG